MVILVCSSLALLTILAAFNLHKDRHEVISMELALSRAWMVQGNALQKWAARRHNAGLILNVACTLQAANWFMQWDDDMKNTLAEMEACAKTVRRGLFAVLFDGVDNAYERMVVRSTHLCMRLRPDLIAQIEQVL